MPYLFLSPFFFCSLCCCRFWRVQGTAASSLFEDLVTAGPTFYLVGMQQKGTPKSFAHTTQHHSQPANCFVLFMMEALEDTACVHKKSTFCSGTLLQVPSRHPSSCCLQLSTFVVMDWPAMHMLLICHRSCYPSHSKAEQHTVIVGLSYTAQMLTLLGRVSYKVHQDTTPPLQYPATIPFE